MAIGPITAAPSAAVTTSSSPRMSTPRTLAAGGGRARQRAGPDDHGARPAALRTDPPMPDLPDLRLADARAAGSTSQ